MRQKREERELEQQILSLADLLIENVIAASMLTERSQEQQLEVSIEIVAKMAHLLEQYLGDFNEHFETLLQQLAQQKLPDENVLSSFGDFQDLLNTAISKGLILYQQPIQSTEDPNFEQEEIISTEQTDESELSEKILEEISKVAELDSEKSVEKKFCSNERVQKKSTENNFNIIEVEQTNETFETEIKIEKDLIETDESDEIVSFVTENGDANYNEIEYNMDVAEGDIFLDNQKIWEIALKQVFHDVEVLSDYVIRKNVFSYYLPELKLVIDKFIPEKKEIVWKEFYSRQNNLTYLQLSYEESKNLRQLVRTLKWSFVKNSDCEISKII